MKKISLFLFITVHVLSNKTLNSQIVITDKLIDSVYSTDANLGLELNAIKLYNTAMNDLNMSDSINVFAHEDELHFYYGDERLKNLHSTDLNVPMRLQYARNLENKYIQADAKTGKFSSFRLYINEDKNCSKITKLENYTSRVLDGFYTRYCEDGKIYSQGHYKQIDSIYLDTMTVFDYNTYEERIRITEHSKFPVKCGEWVETVDGYSTKVIYLKCD